MDLGSAARRNGEGDDDFRVDVSAGGAAVDKEPGADERGDGYFGFHELLSAGLSDAGIPPGSNWMFRWGIA